MFAGMGRRCSAILYVAYEVVQYTIKTPGAMMLLGLVSTFLCPPSLISVSPLAIYEPPYAVGGPGLWLIIGLVNSVLYAGIGAAYVGLRKKRDGALTT